MNQLSRYLRNSSGLIILIFPLFYLIVGGYFRLILSDPSLRSVDPDYVYFMTGLNISEGFLKVAHIDHPGTPLQYLIAIVFRLVWLFRDNPSGYVTDVLDHADLYLAFINLSITIILFLSLYISGKYVLRKTGSLLYAMLVQTVPLISVILYEIIGRIMPELLLPLPILWLTTFLIARTKDEKENFSNADLIVLGLIMGFGLSIKLTLIPLWIIPLIIVPGWKDKLKVAILSVISFLIIALPVTLQLERFWNWTKALFLHSGQYGNGDENIVNISKFIQNFWQMTGLQKYYTFLVLFMVLFVVFLIVRSKKRSSDGLKEKTTILIAVLLAIFAQVIISGKQYEPRYFMPALMFGPLLIFLFIEVIKEFNQSKVLKNAIKVLLSLFLGWILLQQFQVIKYTSTAFETQITARKETRDIAKTFEKNSIKIIVSQDYGCPFVEYALQFSLAWSVPQVKPQYISQLNTLYPNTYQYTTWDGQFRHWGKPFNIPEIISNKIPVYLYLEKNTEELYNHTIDKLLEKENHFVVDKKMIYENPVNGECLLQLSFSAPDKVKSSRNTPEGT